MAEKDMLEQFGEFLEAKRTAEEKAAQSAYDADDFEWWEEDKDGNRRGSRTTVRAARQHGPEWAKAFFAEKEEGKKDDEGGKKDEGGKAPVKTLFPARKPAAGQ